MVREILLLGDERLYQACREVSRGEAPELARRVSCRTTARGTARAGRWPPRR